MSVTQTRSSAIFLCRKQKFGLVFILWPMPRISPWRWLCSRRPPQISNIASRHRRSLMAGLPSRSSQQSVLWESLHNPADWETVPPSADLPGYSVFKKDIRKPEVDDRDYRYIKLKNDLEALLIHDPNADKSAASLDVEIGHLHDPVSLIIYELFVRISLIHHRMTYLAWHISASIYHSWWEPVAYMQWRGLITFFV